MRSLWLMYHDVYSQLDPELPRSAAMYHVSRQAFRAQLQAIRESGIPVDGPRKSRRSGPGRSLVITFDDGWAGTFRNAVPLLEEYGFPGAIFLTRDFVGGKGFCDRSMLREGLPAGVEIGVHGATHRMLSACSYKEILAEFADCKDFLEQMLSTPVRLAALPGGDINDRIIAAAQEAGLECLCTSQPGINHNRTSDFRLRRVAIREATDSVAIERFCRLDVRREVARWAVLETPRFLLGMKNYSILRRAMLDLRGNGRTREVFRP